MSLTDSTWLRRLLGIDDGSIPAGAEPEFLWMNQPHSWQVFVLIGAVAALVWLVFSLYRREIETCPRWAKMTLAGLRTAVILVLLVVFLGPAIAYTQRRTLQPQVVLMLDGSQSMNTRDRYLDENAAARVGRITGESVEGVRERRPSRADLLSHVFEKDNRALLAELERRGKLRVATFSNRVVRLEDRRPRLEPKQADRASDGSTERDDSIEPLPKFTVDGQATDVHRAILDGLSDKHTAAVILVTDGQHTGAEDARAAAKKAEELGVPLLVVGIGDPARPRDLEVAEVYADPQVWQDDPFEIQALLRARGISGETVEVELIERKAPEAGGEPGPETVLERRSVPIAAGAGQVRLVFKHTARAPGRMAYSVRAALLPNELSKENNEPKAPAEVKVLSEQARVLLIAGSPTWEYRGVQRLLQRERSVDLSCWLQTIDPDRPQDGNTVITSLPTKREELFKYDVIMLFDPDPREFDEAFIELLGQFAAEHAGGVLYMAGPKFSGRFLGDGRTGRMRDILPVRLGDVGAMEVASMLASNIRAWPLGVVAANVDQPIMRFDADPIKSLETWKSLPGIFWSFPSQEAKPATRVLIEHSDPTLRRIEGSRPLLVTGQYGRGRTVFMGFSGTWRWRRAGQNSEFFNRFWIQTSRFLVEGRSLEGKGRGTIETERYRYELGDRIAVSARLMDASLMPLEQDEVKAALRVDGADPVPVVLRQIPNQPGQFETTVTATQTGRHVLAVDLTNGGTSQTPLVETTFLVAMPSVESNEIWLNKPLLVDLAKTSGGRYFEIDEAASLAENIPDRQRTLDVRSKPLPLWDTYLLLFVLVGLLSAEWGLRKGFKLL